MTPSETVRAFIAAVEAKDLDTAVGLLADDVRYENMPIDPIVGREAVRATLAMFLEPAGAVEWPVLRELVDGDCVVNERLDRFRIGDGWLESNEDFFVNLSNPVNLTIVDDMGVGTIVHDDGGSGSFLDVAKIASVKPD